MVEYKKRSVTKSMKENTPAFMLISQYKNAKVLRDYIEEQMDEEHMKLKEMQDQLDGVNDKITDISITFKKKFGEPISEYDEEWADAKR